MDAHALFLRRCAQVATLLESHEEGDLVDLSAYLRELLMDRHCLVDTVNRGRGRLSLEFRVGTFHYKADKHTAILTLEDGIDPETSSKEPHSNLLALTHKQFLKHAVLWSFGSSLTVYDVVKHAAVVAGGVHHDPYDKSILSHLSKRQSVGGLPLGIRMLKAIARVVLRGLDPLIKKIEAAG